MCDFDSNNREFSLELALKAYTEHRNPDAKAICELAMYNYVEVSIYYRTINSTTSWLYKLEELLNYMYIYYKL